MSLDPRTEALAIWLVQQQQSSQLAQQQTKPGELHLHQHHHAAPAPLPIAEPEQEEYRTVRMHPLLVAAFMLCVSVAISLPIALIAAIVEAGSRPDVQYVQPSRGGW